MAGWGVVRACQKIVVCCVDMIPRGARSDGRPGRAALSLAKISRVLGIAWFFMRAFITLAEVAALEDVAVLPLRQRRSCMCWRCLLLQVWARLLAFLPQVGSPIMGGVGATPGYPVPGGFPPQPPPVARPNGRQRLGPLEAYYDR